MKAVTLTLDGMKPLIRSLQAMPVVMRTRIVVPALGKSINTVRAAILPLIPVNQSTRVRRNGLGKIRPRIHYRDALTSVVREYPTTGIVVALTGAESGKAPHAHLIEDGTKQRFTNSKPIYGKMAVGVKTVLKGGKLVTRSVRQKKSTGSRLKRKNAAQLNRGRMPAFHPVERGVANATSTVRTELAASIASGITREFTAAKLSRGVV